MVGVKKLNEKRVNPCRSVVNNLGVVKIKGWAVLRDTLPAAGRELDERNLNYWSSGNRHKEGRSFTKRLNYGTGEANNQCKNATTPKGKAESSNTDC